METMENRIKSGLLEIGRSLKALIFCYGNSGKQDEKADLTSTLTSTGDNLRLFFWKKDNCCHLNILIFIEEVCIFRNNFKDEKLNGNDGKPYGIRIFEEYKVFESPVFY